MKIIYPYELSKRVCVTLNNVKGIGTLRDQELRSLLESEPEITKGIADHFNVSIGQLRGLIHDEIITFEIVKKSYDQFKQSYLDHGISVKWNHETIEFFNQPTIGAV